MDTNTAGTPEVYDVIIVGAGPAGIFSAIALVRACPQWRILLVERGKPIAQRSCPARRTHCAACTTCNILTGWGGAGAFSDGKLTLSKDVGGWLGDFLDARALEELINDADKLWLEFGATPELCSPRAAVVASLAEEARQAGMKLLPMRVRHIGSDRSPAILQAMYDYLQSAGVKIRTETAAERIVAVDGRVAGVVLADGIVASSNIVVVAPGRDGASWLAAEARRLGLQLRNNAVDIGVRVEVPASVTERLTRELYEAKLIRTSALFGDEVRTFCMNPYGAVTTESYGAIITVNGHSYAGQRTSNTNFAVLVSQSFTQPFNDPLTYGTSIARLANLLGEGILVQRLGDLRRGHRSTPERLRGSAVTPTLPSATPGDLSCALPYRHLTGVLDFLEAMDHLVPGVADDSTLLYGVEVKFYSSRVAVSCELETKIAGLYAIGDGAGITRGLIQASASGLLVGRSIVKRLGNGTTCGS